MRNSTARTRRGVRLWRYRNLPPANTILQSLVATAAVLAGAAGAQGGPCTEQIAQLERQVAGIVPGPESGPTGSQTIGARLHRQPTSDSVERAEHVANKDADEGAQSRQTGGQRRQ